MTSFVQKTNAIEFQADVIYETKETFSFGFH